jgi:hypothetical protein
MTYWPNTDAWAHVPASLPREPYLDGNDWAAFDWFAGRVRAMTDNDLAEKFGITSPDTVAMLRELAAS